MVALGVIFLFIIAFAALNLYEFGRETDDEQEDDAERDHGRFLQSKATAALAARHADRKAGAG